MIFGKRVVIVFSMKKKNRKKCVESSVKNW